jgi:hypothetical protein
MTLSKQQRVLMIGAIIGAILGSGTAYLLMTAPAGDDDDKKDEPITAGELLAVTGAAAALIRKLDDFRRKL